MIIHAKNRKDDSDQTIQTKGEKIMKKLMQNKSLAFRRGVFAVVTLAVFWITMAPFGAEAALQGSAGNTIIRNTVTVAYKDNNSVAQTAVTSTISITVNTVAAAPTVLSITPSPGSTDGAGATQAYTVVVRTNSNGPGAVSFGTADGTLTNISAGTAPTVPGNIFLGSTVFDPSNFPGMGAQSIAANATISIAIPNDGGVPTDSATTGGGTGDSIVNALAVNDTVYIYDGTNYYGPLQVTSVTDNGVGSGATATPDSITLKNISGATLSFTPAYGWEILEAKSVTVTVIEGTVTDPAQVASWVTTVTATMGGLSGTNTVQTNAHAGQLTVQKYVRNVTDTTKTGGGSTLVNPPINNAVTYYQTGVSGKPGDILEYAVSIKDSGTGNATAVIATDPIPTYSTLVNSSGAYGANNTGGASGTFAQVYRNATTANIKMDNSGGTANVGYGKSTGQAAASTMTFYLGAGSTASAGGTLNTSETAYIIYQTKID
jgi:hypothetical protein